MIKGNKISFRALEFQDLEQLRDWRNVDFIRKECREFRLLNMEDQIKWFKSLNNSKFPDHIMFGVLNNDDELIGVCGLTYINWKNRNAELSLYLGFEKWWRMDEAKESMYMLLDYGFNTLNMHRIFQWKKLGLDSSLELLEDVGMVYEGKAKEVVYEKGCYYDVALYRMLNDEWRKTHNSK